MATHVSTPKLFRNFKRGSPLTVTTKQVVLNVYAKLREEHPREGIAAVVKLTSQLTGVSKATVWRFKKEGKESGGKPRLPRRSIFCEARQRPRRKDRYEEQILCTIRRIVHSYFFRNEPPTIAKVLDEVNNDENLPNFTYQSLRRLMRDIGFSYERRKRTSFLIDREDIQLQRRAYLRKIKAYRQEDREIYYLDETWVNAGHHKNHVWQDTTILSSRQAKEAELSTGLITPSGKGNRLIIIHAGNEKGFVQGALDIFVGKKTGDYHEEMNGPHFEDWFENTLLPKLKANSVIVMDNASYHSVKLEIIPNTSTRKKDIQDWLTKKGVSWSSDMIIRELLVLVNGIRSKFEGYRVDTIAAEKGHVVLRLPPYHCELNPIELVWGHIKERVAKENKNFSMRAVKVLAEAAIDNETPEMWKNSVCHAKKVEEKFWELDNMVDVVVEPLIINFTESSDDEDYSSSESN